MKDGTTHLAYKPEHAVDLDTGVIVAIHPADQGDTHTLAAMLEQAMLDLVGLAPTPETPAEIKVVLHDRLGVLALGLGLIEHDGQGIHPQQLTDTSFRSAALDAPAKATQDRPHDPAFQRRFAGTATPSQPDRGAP